MIFGIDALAFCLLMLCAFSAGILGASLVILVYVLRRKKRRAKDCILPERNWQKLAKVEQLYNGR